jgi:hypothetical protein
MERIAMVCRILESNIAGLKWIDMIRYTIWYGMIWYDMMIWYMIWWYIYLQLGWHPVAVVHYTFTHKQYIEQHNRHKQYTDQHNRHKQYIEQYNSLIRKSANRAPSSRGIPWHLPYNWGKSKGKTLSQGSWRMLQRLKPFLQSG